MGRYFLILSILYIGCSTTNTHKLEPVVLPIINASESVNSKAIPVYEIADSIKKLIGNSWFIKNYEQKECYQITKDFYQENKFLPCWTMDSSVYQIRQLIGKSANHGLNPNDYFKVSIDSIIGKFNSETSVTSSSQAQLDILLTAAVIKYRHHLLLGKVNPYELDSHWNYKNDDIHSYDSVLFELLIKGQVKELDKYFEPKLFGYKQLKLELEKYRKLNTINTENIAIQFPGFLIRKGDSNEFVIPIKKKLAQLSLYTQDSLTLNFDDSLELAVVEFQKIHGLTADGLPGRKTYMYLEWDIQDYINALVVNLERIRWLPRELSTNRLIVNIPSYSLQLFQNNQLKINTKIIVGKFKTKTPIFQSAIDYLVFNPCWTIPNSIATKKMLPKLKTDSLFLVNRNMFIMKNGVRVPQDSIDFLKYSEDYFPYKIFQNSGPENALGKVKFMFPNSYQVYLHDTPNSHLFNKNIRAFSSGCVRVQNALNLAETILLEMDKHKYPISMYLDKGYPEKVYLNSKLELDILYHTVVYDETDNKIKFYYDVYYRDNKVITFMNN